MAQIKAISRANGYRWPESPKARDSTINASTNQPIALR